MLTKILKVMAIVILLPVFTMCTALSVEMFNGATEGYNEAEAAAEAKEKTI